MSISTSVHCSVCDPAKMAFTSKLLVPYFFPTPPIKLKLVLQMGRRLLIATHLEQLNYLLVSQKQGAINGYNLAVSIRLFQGSFGALKAVYRFSVIVVFQWIDWIQLQDLIQDF
jgi:hypothetical protein